MPDALEHFAFSADKVCALTTLTKRQLSYWDRTGFFSPEFDALGAHVYSFRDVVGLRTIAQLRETVPLQELRKVGRWLREKHDRPWSSLRFYRSGRVVHFKDPTSAEIKATRPMGQTVCIEMEEIVTKTRSLIKKRRRREGADVGQVSKRRSVVRNAAVLAGTRIPVEAIWNFRQAGYSVRRILKEYPSLKRQDIAAALDYQQQATGTR